MLYLVDTTIKFCVCNHACLTTKRYGRDYKSHPAVGFLYAGLRGSFYKSPSAPIFQRGGAKAMRTISN